MEDFKDEKKDTKEIVDNSNEDRANIWRALRITMMIVLPFDALFFLAIPVWLFGWSAVIFFYKVSAVIFLYFVIFAAILTDNSDIPIVNLRICKN